MKNVVLVKTVNCPFCPTVDKLWLSLQKKHKFDYKTVDASTEEGMKLVEKYGIMSVPTTIIDDQVKFVGVPSKNKAEEAVNQ
ncbi:MAG TPA: thioredoxin family protein [archaeon]|nr:thioredoxin family protein [archaeon]